jgi:predicted dehydrogenase
VVYVATPNSLHAEHCLAALTAGKPVICEKPFAVTADEAHRVIDSARKRGLFCMEAMWMRFLPATRRACELIEGGAIGDVLMVAANFGHRPAYDPENRFFNPALGGGAFLDVGVYALSLAVLLLGSPQRVMSDAAIGPSGVDEQSTAVLTYADGRTAVLTASLKTYLPTDAVISGTEGEIRLAPLYRPAHLTVRSFSQAAAGGAGGRWRRRVRNALRPRGPGEYVPFEGNGFNYEAAEVERCLDAGLKESPLMPLDETMLVMETLDTIRSQWPPVP